MTATLILIGATATIVIEMFAVVLIPKVIDIWYKLQERRRREREEWDNGTGKHLKGKSDGNTRL